MFLLAAPLASLFFFSSFAVSGIYAPECSTSWKWAFNSLGQNPCMVAAHLMSTCSGGSFTINSLNPGYHYTGPIGSDNTDPCRCNTVAYSLISACDACQGEDWTSWLDYKHNCTTVLPLSSFPNPVPYGTRVPYWALIDVTIKDTWDALKSYTIGGTPEAGPGTILGHPIRFVNASKDYPLDATPQSMDSDIPPTNAPTWSSSWNAYAAAAIIVCRVAVLLLIICAAIFFYLRRQRPRVQCPTSVGDDAYHPQRKFPLEKASLDTSTLAGTLTTLTKPTR